MVLTVAFTYENLGKLAELGYTFIPPSRLAKGGVYGTLAVATTKHRAGIFPLTERDMGPLVPMEYIEAIQLLTCQATALTLLKHYINIPKHSELGKILPD